MIDEDVASEAAAFLTHSPDAALLVNEEGCIEKSNYRAEQIFGYGPGGLVGQSIDMLVPSEQRSKHGRFRQRFIGGPQRGTMAMGRELMAVKADGTLIAVDIGLSPIISKKGAVSILAVIRDIGERLRLQTLRTSIETFLNISPDPTLLVDDDGRIFSCNGAAEKLFGYDEGQLEGVYVEELVPESAREGHPQLRREYQGAPKTRPMGIGRELELRRKDGTQLPVEISLAPTGGGQTIATLRDVSHRRGRSS